MTEQTENEICRKYMGYVHNSGTKAYCGDDVGTHIIYCNKCKKKFTPLAYDYKNSDYNKMEDDHPQKQDAHSQEDSTTKRKLTNLEARSPDARKGNTPQTK